LSDAFFSSLGSSGGNIGIVPVDPDPVPTTPPLAVFTVIVPVQVAEPAVSGVIDPMELIVVETPVPGPIVNELPLRSTAPAGVVIVTSRNSVPDTNVVDEFDVVNEPDKLSVTGCRAT